MSDVMGNPPVFVEAAGARTPKAPPSVAATYAAAVSFHTFRHTCASLLFEAGRNVKQVQAWLGHADPGFTLKTYIHLMDAGVGDASFLDRAVAKPDQDSTRPLAAV